MKHSLSVREIEYVSLYAIVERKLKEKKKKKTMEDLHRESVKVGLMVDMEKTKVMPRELLEECSRLTINLWNLYTSLCI